ncbi:MAG: ATP-binding protein [Pseudomonadota bacterium]
MTETAPTPALPTPSSRRRSDPTRGLFFAAALLTVLAMLGAHAWSTQRHAAQLAQRSEAALSLWAEILNGWLGRYRTLTAIYARNSEIAALLRAPEDGVMVELVNARLELLNGATGAADTYVLDADGVTVAASNWAEPISFMGNDYSFRPYFKQAMQGRLGRYFALGTSSGKRGYFFSHPVRDRNKIVGVVVVKVPVDAVEQEMRGGRDQLFVSDQAGVVVLAGDPRLRMTTLGPLSKADRRRIAINRQFDLARLAPAPIEGLRAAGAPADGLVRARQDRLSAPLETMRHFSRPMPVEGWTLHLLTRTAESQGPVWTATISAGLAGAVVSLIGLAFLQRRRRLIDQLDVRAAAQRELERAVAERTADLRATNAQLACEVRERQETEAELRHTQDELVQAAKLAALGQMSTTLSHEFNQPLGAIRAYAENATAFIERGRPEAATENLARIGRLTERMARLSKHLTSFARKPGAAAGPTPLRTPIEDALNILQARVERSEAEIAVDCPEDLIVWGGVTRFQHVFINLIGNALDACAAVERPRIDVRARALDGDRVELVVEDNGVGLSDAVREKLFDPFFSTKEAGAGLGLGLSITFNILRDFGGRIRAENRADGPGARFILDLRATTEAGAGAALEAAE